MAAVVARLPLHTDKTPVNSNLEAFNGPLPPLEISDSLSASDSPKTVEWNPAYAETGHIDTTTTHLVSSPYSNLANQLRLDGLDLQCRLFAFAMTVLQPIRVDYATAPYLESFNWDEVFATIRLLCQRSNRAWQEQDFYVVIFRSKLKEGIDRDRLGLLDQKSHEEACASGGLLKYWFGEPDSARRNLATCLWRNHQDAFDGGQGPWHKQARAAAREMYEYIDFHVHRLIVKEGAESWELSQVQ